MLLAMTEELKQLPLLPVSSMFYVRSFLWPTFTNVRAPNIWYLKTALSLIFFQELFVHITFGQLTCRLLKKWKSRCLRHLHSAGQNERNCKESAKRAGNWGYKNVLTCFSHLLSRRLLYNRLRLSTLVSRPLEVKWYAASWFLHRWAKA